MSVGGHRTDDWLDTCEEFSPPSRTPLLRWEARYRACVIVSDLLSLVVVTGVVALVNEDPAAQAPSGVMVALVLVTVVAGGTALLVHRVWDQSVLGQGVEEYRRLGRALLTVTVAVALVGLAVGLPQVRWWVFLSLPLVAMAVFPLRYALRKVLHARRLSGRCLLPVIAAGSAESVMDLITRIRQEPHNGWQVRAACIPAEARTNLGDEVNGVPVVGTTEDVAEIARSGHYRVVAITADEQWSSQRLQRLAWTLEGSPAELVVAPVLLEITGPRLHISPVFGFPLLRLSAPAFTGPRRVIKECTDRGLAALMAVVLAPLILTIAVLVRASGPGPVLYRQRRIGRGGGEFTMLKFRTMVPDADSRRRELSRRNDAEGPLFKLRRDPRVTRIGAVLRRYSLDELPQLFNILGGSMSLVGPRPPLQDEVRFFGPESMRRLLVKPGLTGMWQVSGRSDLSWDEAVRLDLRYVENWSLALDVVILWKTVRAVAGGKGAY